MTKHRGERKQFAREIARERIKILFDLASQVYKQHPERSDAYVALGRRIGMRYNVRIPRELKRRMCKHCHCFLVPGRNARVRLRGKYITITCLNCRRQMRFPY
ncbi:MAG: ribonuclease P protein component 4 [Methanocellales archaeon]